MIALHVTGKLPTRQPASGFTNFVSWVCFLWYQFSLLLIVIEVWWVTKGQSPELKKEASVPCNTSCFECSNRVEECYIILKLYNLVTTSRLVSPTSPKSPFKVIYCVACPLCRHHHSYWHSMFPGLAAVSSRTTDVPTQKNPLHHHGYRSGKNYNRKQSDTVIKVTFSICRCSKGPQRWA